MSRIYFHTKKRDAEVRGSERAWLGMLCGGLLLNLLDHYLQEVEGYPSVLRDIFRPGAYVLDFPVGEHFNHAARNAIKIGMGTQFVIDGEEVEIWVAALNTALTMGNDAIKLAARLHGQCELHAYVENENRGWLTGIIHQGLKSGIYRQNQGWMDVLDLLADPLVSGPFVTSYSVCRQFPNSGVIEAWGTDEESREQFNRMPDDCQWNYAMAALRMQETLELKPDNWNDYYFRNGWDGFKIDAHLTKLESKRNDHR